jgi:hypothetical protein
MRLPWSVAGSANLTQMPDWSIFNGFVPPHQVRSWTVADAWAAEIETLLGAERAVVLRGRQQSDTLLRDLGGDPSARDWTAFRLLRREREEDWSDWLAQLIEDSVTGHFAWSWLGQLERRAQHAYLADTVHREVSHEGCRADLVIEWLDDTYTHIEVKVGDPNLAKTRETSQKMAMRFGGHRRRSDVVLLLTSQRDAWAHACGNDAEMGKRVQLRCWSDVARALRCALPASIQEQTGWRMWAHAFCGAIEQDLMYIRADSDPESWVRRLNLSSLAAAAQLLGPESNR